MSLRYELNTYTNYEKKFIHYKFQLDNAFDKLNELILNNSNKKNKIRYLTNKVELLLLITSNYKLLIDNQK
jgi:hypothetical protein